MFWQGSLKWNRGVHNTMIYVMGNLPVAEFDLTRLVNLGFGHWSVHGGAGYTYFNPQTGHIDWGASKFLNQHVHIGAVGYLFQQLTGDSGSGAKLGDMPSSATRYT